MSEYVYDERGKCERCGDNDVVVAMHDLVEMKVCASCYQAIEDQLADEIEKGGE